MAVLMVPVKQITKPAIEERFIVCFFGPVLRKTCIINPLSIEGFCVWFSSEYSDSASIPYKMVIFPQFTGDISKFIVEVVCPTFYESYIYIYIYI